MLTIRKRSGNRLVLAALAALIFLSAYSSVPGNAHAANGPEFTYPPAVATLSSTFVVIEYAAEGLDMSSSYILLLDHGAPEPSVDSIIGSGRQIDWGWYGTGRGTGTVSGLQPEHSYDAYLLFTKNGVPATTYKLEFTTTAKVQGYTWQKLGPVDASGVLVNIGPDRFVVRGSKASQNASIVDFAQGTSRDLGYPIMRAYALAEDDFFFTERAGSGTYYLRRSVSGVVYDRMPCEITNPQYLVGDSNEVFSFREGVARYNPALNVWQKIDYEAAGLPQARFLTGACTSGYLYLGGYLSSNTNRPVLYRYNRTSGEWADISPVGLNLNRLQRIWALNDEDILAVTSAAFGDTGHIYRYRNGNWAEEAAFDVSYLQGTTSGSIGLGAGLIFVHRDTAQFFDGTSWRELELPADLTGTPSPTNACTGLDGSVYFAIGSDLYKLTRYAPSDTTPPAINVTGLSEGMTVSSPELSFTVSAYDQVDGPVVPVVKLGGAGGQVIFGTRQPDGSFLFAVTLAEGENSIHIEATDDSGNRATATYTVTYNPAPSDTTPPQFAPGYPSVDNIVPTGFTLRLKLNEPGTAYYRVVEEGVAPGSEYESWTPAEVPGTEEVSRSISGLSAGTAYEIYLIAKDAAGNWQNAPVKLSVTLPPAAGGELQIERVGTGGFSLDDTASVTVSISNQTTASQPVTLIVCLYDEQSKAMVAYDSTSREVGAGEQAELTAGGLTIPSSGAYTLKALVWDSFEGMRPLLAVPLVWSVE
ncbi:MAG: hypothetical protein QHH27_08120 [Clostridia bacterium]|jgi:hypothetical protein|nr:hypothetical protein [Clostridia bacterium]MDH7573495.1 hypothetical protein [Clostridia bacterium]